MGVSSDDSSTIINADDETLSSEMSTNVLGRSALTSLVRLPTLLFSKGRAISQLRRHLTGSFVFTYVYLQYIHPLFYRDSEPSSYFVNDFLGFFIYMPEDGRSEPITAGTSRPVGGNTVQ